MVHFLVPVFGIFDEFLQFPTTFCCCSEVNCMCEIASVFCGKAWFVFLHSIKDLHPQCFAMFPLGVSHSSSISNPNFSLSFTSSVFSATSFFFIILAFPLFILSHFSIASMDYWQETQHCRILNVRRLGWTLSDAKNLLSVQLTLKRHFSILLDLHLSRLRSVQHFAFDCRFIERGIPTSSNLLACPIIVK